MGIVLKGGSVVNADSVRQQDLRMEGEVVDRLGTGLETAGDEVIDVSGCYLFPGGIDPHTHFDLAVGSTVTADDFFSGTQAALAGGTTTIIDYATQSRGGRLAEALSVWHEKARNRSFTDYGFHLALCDCRDAVLQELEALPLAQGVTSVKLYMAYKGVLQLDDASLMKVMKVCREQGMRVCLHCENGDLIQELVNSAKAAGKVSPDQHAATRPETVEAEAVFRAICLAELTGCPLYIVHVSTERALRLIESARQRFLPVSAETCPQYLLLDETCYEKQGFEAAKYVMSPPLRNSRNQAGLWRALAEGTISCVGSDHCSFNFVGQKELGRNDFSRIPNGAPGVENRFGLLYTFGVAAGRLTLQQFVAAVSTNAARLFGLYPRKGVLASGSDADIVVWDPERRTRISASTQVQHVDYNAYEGMEQTGIARHVFLRGTRLVDDGRLRTGSFHAGPTGKYLPRKPVAVGEENA